MLMLLLALAACTSASEKQNQRRNRADPAASVTATSAAAGAGSASAGGGSGAATGSDAATLPPGSEGFETATEPTAIVAAYLTAYRDAPSTVDVAADAITVFAVVRDPSGKPLPKPLNVDLAVVSFDDGTEIGGVVDSDPQHDYHVTFKVPKLQLATQSVGKDQIKGRIKVASPVFATPTLETDIVIWLANVVLTVERADYGVLQLPKLGEPELALKLHVAVSGYEQPAQNALLKGLAGDLSIGGGTCPPLAEAVPQDLTMDCDLQLVPRDVMVLDRVLTLTYYNGVREDFASVILRGETALVLDTPGFFGTLAAHEGKLVASTHRLDSIEAISMSYSFEEVVVWSEMPKRSGVPPDVILASAGDEASAKFFQIGRVVFAGDRLVVLGSFSEKDFWDWDAWQASLFIWEQVPKSSNTKPDFRISRSKFPFTGSYDGKRLFVGELGLEPDYGRFVAFEDVASGVPNPVAAFPELTVPTMTTSVGRLEFAGDRYFEMNDQRLRIWKGTWPFDYLHAEQTIGGPYFALRSAAEAPAENFSMKVAASDGKSLAISDGSRILVWEKWPIGNEAPADFILGQRDFVTNVPNLYGDSVESINAVQDLIIVGDKLVISDGRIVVRSLPRTRPKLELPQRPVIYLDGETAPGLLSFRASAFELGIVDREAATERLLAVEYSGSTDVTVKGASFDRADFRFVGGAYPGTSGTCGTTINGGCLLHVALEGRRQGRRQSKLELAYENGATSRTASITLQASVQPVAFESFEEYRPLANGGANTLLAWDTCVYVYRGNGPPNPLANVPVEVLVASGNTDCFKRQNPDYPLRDAINLGQMDYAYNGWLFAAVSGGRLYSGTTGAVLVHRSVPAISNAPADFRLNLAGAPEANLRPRTALAAGGRLYVSMCDEPSRLLVWNSIPDGEVAPDAIMTYPTPNADACVTDILSIDGKLIAGFVSGETGSGGLFVWDTLPGAAGAPSRVVTGLFHEENENEAFDPGLIRTRRFAWDGTRFYVVDHAGHAVRVWFGVPDPYRDPDVVIGQLEKDGVESDQGGVGNWSFRMPRNVVVTDDRVYVSDVRGVKIFRPPTP